jgi:hypothetical protein
MIKLPEQDFDELKKRNRIKRLAPKAHKIAHESGRSTKTLWANIVLKTKSGKK